MRIGSVEVKRRVWVGLAFAFSVTTAWWIWQRRQQVAIEQAAVSRAPFVQLAANGAGAAGQVVRERVELMDPKPLFFPTEWNYGQRPLRESMRRQPGDVFGSFPPNLEFGGQGIKAYGSEGVMVPEKLADVLAQGNEVPFDGIGQVDTRQPSLTPRSAFLEVFSLKSGEIIFNQLLGNIFIPKPDFSPLEYLVAVDSTGIVGDPILIVGAEGEEVDERVDGFFRSYLVKGLHLGERLMPGEYRVLVGP